MPMPYRIKLHRSAAKFLEDALPSTRQRLQTAINALATNPRPANCLKLKGSSISWRIRVGDYRVLYDVLDDQLLIWVFKVDRRKEDTY
jgi:mRNA interferase RelE/StbE